jgi:hypothetical protein
VSAALGAAMEDVLELDEEPEHPSRPQVNFEEPRQQWIGAPREPLPAAPGQPPRDA